MTHPIFSVFPPSRRDERFSALSERLLDQATYRAARVYMRLRPPSHLPVRFLQDFFPGIENLSITLQHTVELKALPYGEAFVLSAIAQFLRPRTVFEIGTYRGGGTVLMAHHAGPETRVYTLDLPPGRPTTELQGLAFDQPEANAARIGELFRGTAYASQITQLYGDSAAFDFSPYAGQVDLVFVDGSHSYEYVRNDTFKALEMLSPGGTIIWDDCGIDYPGAVRALDEIGQTLPISRIASTRFAIYTRYAPAT